MDLDRKVCAYKQKSKNHKASLCASVPVVQPDLAWEHGVHESADLFLVDLNAAPEVLRKHQREGGSCAALRPPAAAVLEEAAELDAVDAEVRWVRAHHDRERGQRDWRVGKQHIEGVTGKPLAHSQVLA